MQSAPQAAPLQIFTKSRDNSDDLDLFVNSAHWQNDTGARRPSALARGRRAPLGMPLTAGGFISSIPFFPSLFLMSVPCRVLCAGFFEKNRCRLFSIFFLF